jgi:hypothetical protein
MSLDHRSLASSEDEVCDCDKKSWQEMDFNELKKECERFQINIRGNTTKRETLPKKLQEYSR